MWVRQLRRVVQIAFLVLFVVLLWQATWHPGSVRPTAAGFLKADPLAMLTSVLASGSRALSHFYPAIVILVATVLLGRFWCGWICPLGTCLDITDKILFRKQCKDRGQLPQLKYYILAAVLVAALFSKQIAWLLDPIPLLTRFFAVVLYPLAVGAYNLGVIHGREALLALGVRAYPVQPVGFSLSIAVAVMFIALIALGALSRRYWCRNLCPLGALLALVGRFGFWKRQVAEGCIHCRRCERECKMGAIPADSPEVTRTPECILCYNCMVCPQPGVNRIGLSLRMKHGADAATDIEKRQLLAGVGAGLAYAIVAKFHGHRPGLNPRLLRPPGAIVRGPGGIRAMTEEEFCDLCLRCGECMRACPTGGLQPAVAQAGLDGVFTPILVPRIGECTEKCTVCGDVCPSGALIPFALQEKKNDIKIGLATIDENKCLAWQPGKDYRLCLVCDEQCPYDAIEMQLHGPRRLKRPHVVADKCTGCGTCENVCPVEPEAAIVVNRLDSRSK